MICKIQHAAIVSENFVREARFYEAAFGMKRSKPGSAEEEKAIRTNYAVSISDGYVGVTVIGRKPGYIPGLHHFGVDVDDVEEAIRRVRCLRLWSEFYAAFYLRLEMDLARPACAGAPFPHR